MNRKTLDNFDRCWHIAGHFRHNDTPVSEDTRYKIAFTLWKENAVLDQPDTKDLTDQSSGIAKVPDKAFDKNVDIPF